jgi:two-component system chemotaxis sensor kinase CheA
LSEIIALPDRDTFSGAEDVHLRHKGKSIALVVDELVGTQAVLQRPLDPLIQGIRLYQGSVEFAYQQVAMVLSVPELFRLARRSAGVQTPLPARRRARVLVVDDSQFTRELVVDVFERMGFEVAEAEEGRRGVDRFEDAGADLIVTDLDMPVLDGFGLIEAVRAVDSRVPIAVFTTRATSEARDRALQLGANVFLVKTEFRERQLHDLVERYISRS